MNTAFIPKECDCDEDEHREEHDSLFVFGKFENAEKTPHSIVMCTLKFEYFQNMVFYPLIRSCHS